MTPIVLLNGEFIRESDAAIPVDDGGWLHGAGVFETMLAENGRVFRPAAHLQRLRRSAAELLAPIEPDDLPDEETLRDLLRRNDLTSARVRLTVTAGSVRSGLSSDVPRPNVCATAAPLSAYPEAYYVGGVHVAICDYRVSPSDPLAGHKTTSYLPRLLGLRRARRVDCFEALWFTTANRLAEGSITNVWIAKNGVLKTPPLNTPVLPGIARGVVLDIARATGVEVREVPLTVDDVLDADEILLTNAIMQVMPVIKVEKHDISDGRVGPLAKRMLKAYRACVARECAAP